MRAVQEEPRRCCRGADDVPVEVALPMGSSQSVVIPHILARDIGACRQVLLIRARSEPHRPSVESEPGPDNQGGTP